MNIFKDTINKAVFLYKQMLIDAMNEEIEEDRNIQGEIAHHLNLQSCPHCKGETIGFKSYDRGIESNVITCTECPLNLETAKMSLEQLAFIWNTLPREVFEEEKSDIPETISKSRDLEKRLETLESNFARHIETMNHIHADYFEMIGRIKNNIDYLLKSNPPISSAISFPGNRFKQ